MCDLPGPGVELVSLTLPGGFLTTGPLCPCLEIRFHLKVIPYGISLCLASLNMAISSSIHVAAHGIISLFFMANILRYIWNIYG